MGDIPAAVIRHTLVSTLASAGVIANGQPTMGRRRLTCVEVRDPGVGTYRICAPHPRRR